MGELKVSSSVAPGMSALYKSTKQNKLPRKHNVNKKLLNNNGSNVCSDVFVNNNNNNNNNQNGSACKLTPSSRHGRKDHNIKTKGWGHTTEHDKRTETATHSISNDDSNNNMNKSENINGNSCANDINNVFNNYCIPPQHVIRGVKPSTHKIDNYNYNYNFNNFKNCNNDDIVRTRPSPPFVGRGETPSVSRRSRSPQQVMLSSEIYEYLNKIIHTRVNCEVNDKAKRSDIDDYVVVSAYDPVDIICPCKLLKNLSSEDRAELAAYNSQGWICACNNVVNYGSDDNADVSAVEVNNTIYSCNDLNDNDNDGNNANLLQKEEKQQEKILMFEEDNNV